MSKTIEVSDETYEKIKGQLQEPTQQIPPVTREQDLLGRVFFFRTITYHFIGRVVAQFGRFLRLQTASWVANSGRFSNAINTGKLDEVEPLGDWWINLDTITDFGPWKHHLPTQQQ